MLLCMEIASAVRDVKWMWVAAKAPSLTTNHVAHAEHQPNINKLLKSLSDVLLAQLAAQTKDETQLVHAIFHVRSLTAYGL